MNQRPQTPPTSETLSAAVGSNHQGDPSPHAEPAGYQADSALDQRPVIYTPHPWLRPLSRIATGGVWLMVWTYRLTLGPFIGGQCRYVPTCSQYMLDATRKYGPIRGVLKGIGRILRCHPWGGQGHDPA